jgi:hypothetical protein
MLVLTTTAAILACGAIAASAQAPGAQIPGTQSPTIQPLPGGSTEQQQDQVIRNVEPLQDEENSDQDGFFRYRRGLIGMMGGGMVGPHFGHHNWHQASGIAGPMMMRIIFSLMDADGDGKLSLQEFQAAHERIFKAMDANKDGFVTLEEMQGFVRGTSRPVSQQ